MSRVPHNPSLSRIRALAQRPVSLPFIPRRVEPFSAFPVVPGAKLVPKSIKRPRYALDAHGIDHKAQESIEQTTIRIKSEKEIAAMTRAGAIASYIRAFAGSLVKVGVTPEQIDAVCHEEICRLGVYPSPLGYRQFPKSIVSSVNDVLCHGIPDTRPLQPDDIIKIDISVFDASIESEGVHGDCCGTFIVPEASEESKHIGSLLSREIMSDSIMCSDGHRTSPSGWNQCMQTEPVILSDWPSNSECRQLIWIHSESPVLWPRHRQYLPLSSSDLSYCNRLSWLDASRNDVYDRANLVSRFAKFANR